MSSEYDTDIVLWAKHQATLLRRLQAGERVNDQLDFEHLIEEIEDVGNSERRELESRIGTVIEHLIRLIASPATDLCDGWAETIVRSRSEIAGVLDRTPSLRRAVPDIVAARAPHARRLVARVLALYRETPRVDIDTLTFTPEQVLEDWFPDV